MSRQETHSKGHCKRNGNDLSLPKYYSCDWYVFTNNGLLHTSMVVERFGQRDSMSIHSTLLLVPAIMFKVPNVRVSIGFELLRRLTVLRYHGTKSDGPVGSVCRFSQRKTIS